MVFLFFVLLLTFFLIVLLVVLLFEFSSSGSGFGIGFDLVISGNVVFPPKRFFSSDMLILLVFSLGYLSIRNSLC